MQGSITRGAKQATRKWQISWSPLSCLEVATGLHVRTAALLRRVAQEPRPLRTRTPENHAINEMKEEARIHECRGLGKEITLKTPHS
jgi:hypothetical protein